MLHTIEEAIADLRQGKMIILIDDEDRENEGDFLCLAEFATAENINFMAKFGRGLICMPVHAKIADRLQLQSMVTQNTDPHGTAFTVSIDFETTTTGISAFERSDTILNVINPNTTAEQFKRPGHMFPLVAKNGGVLERRGHTEAAVDFARVCGSVEAGVICEIMSDDGTMARLPELQQLAKGFDMKLVSIEQLTQHVQLVTV